MRQVDDPALFHDIVAVGDSGTGADILLHEHDGAHLLQLDDELCDLLNDDRRETFRRLIQKQQARSCPQYAADGKHLLLAAGKLVSVTVAPRLEVGKECALAHVEVNAVQDVGFAIPGVEIADL